MDSDRTTRHPLRKAATVLLHVTGCGGVADPLEGNCFNQPLEQ